jgi:hypothetical protein
MTNEEIQRKLDELEEKRNVLRDINLNKVKESNSFIDSLRSSTDTLQRNFDSRNPETVKSV